MLSFSAIDGIPANVAEWTTNNHNQIGAAAFMEAGNAAVNGGGGEKQSVASIVVAGRKDSGFVR